MRAVLAQSLADFTSPFAHKIKLSCLWYAAILESILIASSVSELALSRDRLIRYSSCDTHGYELEQFKIEFAIRDLVVQRYLLPLLCLANVFVPHKEACLALFCAVNNVE